jgi:integrative and conjugative element protein (TIGR02256 family)
MNDRLFYSSDRRFGLRIPDREVARILKFCRTAVPRETGGVFVGAYTPAHDCAVVFEASAAPVDSSAGPTWFRRGVDGLHRWLRRLWSSRKYYLGEWHFHPHAAPNPSSTDIEQLRAIADSSSYSCPEPLLLILGGDPDASYALRAFVYPQGKELIELSEVRDDLLQAPSASE